MKDDRSGSRSDREVEEAGRRALSALGRAAAPPAAPAEAELRAREAFFAGATGAALPGAEGRPRSAAPGRRSWRRRLVAGVAAAAAALAFFSWAAAPRSGWVVVDLHMADEVLVAGRPPVIGAEVEEGAVQTTPCSEVELSLQDRLRLRFLSDARADLPPGPGRWFGRSRTLRVDKGEVYGSTGGAPLDFRLWIETDETRAVLAGTTFAVIRLEDATCLCLYDGRISFLPRGAETAIELPVGQRVFIYNDSRPLRFEPLDGRERMKLQMLDEATRAGTRLPPPPPKEH